MTVWFLYYGVMFLFFVTPLIDYAMNHLVLMDTLNIAWLIGACTVWWPTVGIDKNPRWEMSHGMRIVNLLIGVPFESFLGIALMTGGGHLDVLGGHSLVRFGLRRGVPPPGDTGPDHPVGRLSGLSPGATPGRQVGGSGSHSQGPSPLSVPDPRP